MNTTKNSAMHDAMTETMSDAMSQPRKRPSLKRRLLLGLLGYVALLSVAVAIHGLVVNERAERLVWQTLLAAELDHLEQREAEDPHYRWADSDSMALYDSRNPAPIPASLRTLAPGLHDGVRVDGQERVALVRETPGRRRILTLDITDLEQRENDMTLTVVGSALSLMLLLGVLAVWGANRLVQPLTRLAGEIAALLPDRPSQRVRLHADASTELEVIARALNDYLARNDRFVERERRFIDMASHELRTPIAVIVGASDLALRDRDATPPLRRLIDRIRQSALGVQELIALLLVLARDPARLRDAETRVALAELLPELIDDHAHLAQDKELALVLDVAAGAEVIGPPQIVRAAIGNLLRNAIENSDRGTIRIGVEAPATVVIEDPGHGMSAVDVSRVYARIARGEARDGGGIGLDLLARLCEHLGWTLAFAPRDAGRGARASLVLRPANPAAGSEA